MLAEYKEKIGLKCQFLIEPKPKEPCKHQYDYGTATPTLTNFINFNTANPDDVVL